MGLTCTCRSGWGVCLDITMVRGSGDGVKIVGLYIFICVCTCLYVGTYVARTDVMK